MSDNTILAELLQKQRKDVPVDKKLLLQDIRRICKNINSSIFDEDSCCVWNGYVTNSNKKKKGNYINFYFKNKKVALHRILYVNYVGDLTKDHYIKYSCENKGICCNVNHLVKREYKKKQKIILQNDPVSDTESDDENQGSKLVVNFK